MRLDDLRVGDTNTTYTADTWNDRTMDWEPYLLGGRWKYWYEAAKDEVMEDLKRTTASGNFRIFRHDTTREV